MKSSTVLLKIAVAALVFDLWYVLSGGDAKLTTEVVIIICSSHICRTIENK